MTRYALFHVLLLIGFFGCQSGPTKNEGVQTGAAKPVSVDSVSPFVSYIANTDSVDVSLYWKDDTGRILGSLGSVLTYIHRKGQKLVFAMNGGMYQENQHPLGLFIQSGKRISPLNTASGHGNFYLKPNGVFYISKDGKGGLCTSTEFQNQKNVLYATQSGPMLVIDSTIHTSFKKGSLNLNIRNGVGILPDGRIVFAMSKQEVSLYDFADYFRKAGCANALYLDGFVSQTYHPAQSWTQTEGAFGVIIGVTQK